MGSTLDHQGCRWGNRHCRYRRLAPRYACSRQHGMVESHSAGKHRGIGDLPVCLGRHEVVLAPAALVLRACLCEDALLHVCQQAHNSMNVSSGTQTMEGRGMQWAFSHTSGQT